jgi:diguanylate cyclase (GGDEF)-like protein
MPVTWQVRGYLTLQLTVATVALVVAAWLALPSLDEVSPVVVAGVILSTVVVTRFPLIHGTGRDRQIYVVDGALFPMAVLLLPPEWALLLLSVPTIVEVFSDRRPLDRRLLFPAAVANGHLVALLLYLGLAGGASLPARLVVATVGSYLSMAIYNGFVVILLQLHGRPPPEGGFRFLSPMPVMYGCSIVPGLIVGVVGGGGDAAFALTLVSTWAFYLLYWQYRRMANASDRMDALFGFTAEVHTLSSAEEVESLASQVAAMLLTTEDVAFTTAAPMPPATAAPVVVGGHARWLVAKRDPTALRSVTPREDSKLIVAIAQVTANALEKLLLAERLRNEARHDALTGVMNRVAFEEACEVLAARAARAGPAADRFAICFGDLDRFKPINDRWGHDVGDEVLRQVADRMRASLRAGDVIARVGGDEFLLLLHDVGGPADVDAAIAHVRSALAAPMTVGDHELEVGISFGVAMWPRDGVHVHELMRVADQRMYVAKRAGRPAELADV